MSGCGSRMINILVIESLVNQEWSQCWFQRSEQCCLLVDWSFALSVCGVWLAAISLSPGIAILFSQ